jgi:plastocyanin
MTRRTTARWLAVGAAAATLALWATPALAADQTVTIQGFAFSEGTVTVTEGDAVTWTNKDGASHTATADDGSFDTEGISSGTSKSITFDTAGTFPYHCKIHSDMTAEVVVQAAAAASPSPASSQNPAPSSGGSGGGTGGNSTPPATETVSTAPTASTGPDIALVSALAILVVGAAAAALLALRLRPAEESEDR